MIYVKRDPSLIPEKILKTAERAQQELETLPENQRKQFIEKKSHIWRAFARFLAKMSYGKCWYSESNDPHSFFDIDHFRPKKEARRSETKIDDGYPWLAFSWENFRYSAGRANRLNTDEATNIVVGKGSWFPLLPDSEVASWTNRCQARERPVLIDPTVRADIDLIDIDANGRACPSLVCVGQIKQERVKYSIELYGLNLGNLMTARKRIMRDIQDHYDNLIDLIIADNDIPAIERLCTQIRRATTSDAPYARAARAKLLSLPDGAQFCAKPEDDPIPIN